MGGSRLTASNGNAQRFSDSWLLVRNAFDRWLSMGSVRVQLDSIWMVSGADIVSMVRLRAFHPAGGFLHVRIFA